MRDRPHGADLLAIARETLVHDILPTLSGDKRIAGLMVANAMAVAAREAGAGDRSLRAHLIALAAFYGERNSTGEAHMLDRELRGLSERLARDLRAGAFDAERLAAIHRILFADARARVEESNPRYLDLERG